jgi:DNA-binding NarL/FixJ family response regulator
VTTKEITVLVVDDHPLVREGVVATLAREPDIRIVGQAADGRAAVRAVAELRPRVVLMDVAMPELNGVEGTRRVLAEAPETVVIALSAHADTSHVSEVLAAGAMGYVIKGGPAEDVVRAVRAGIAGNIYLSPEVASLVVDSYITRVTRETVTGAPALSPREREVLQLVAEGKSTKQIARTLEVSIKTIESHRHQIMHKLRLHSIAELTKYAVRSGLTTLDG